MPGYTAADVRKKAAEKAMADYKKKSEAKKQQMSEGLKPKKMEVEDPKKKKSDDDDDDEESKPKLGSGERFKKLSGELKSKGVKDPDALAASIGRKKYGAAKMAKMAAAGRKKG
tara:strand:- start:127 stop:468 length:342 start_codon:yes stop_codon:yes gene_type:complete